MQLGAKIKALRQYRGWNAEKLAELTGIAPSTIYKYERGETDQMPLRNLYTLSQVLEVPIPDLLELEDHETTDVVEEQKEEKVIEATKENNNTVLQEKMLEVLNDISNNTKEINDKL